MMGVYSFVAKGHSHPLYVGYSKNVNKRIRQHYLDRRSFTKPHDMYIMVQHFDEEKDARSFERLILKKHQPKFNRTHKASSSRRPLDIPPFYEVENMDHVFSHMEPYPWRKYTMIDRIIMNQNKQMYGG